MIYSKKGRSNALASFAKPSRGAPTSFAENFNLSVRQESLNESFRGYEARYNEYEQENLTKIYELTGKKLTPPRAPAATSVRQGVAPSQQLPQQREEYTRQLRELAQLYPDQIRTPEQIQERIKSEAKELEGQMMDVADRQTTGGLLGEFAGAMVAAFNPETNPVNIGTLPLGGGPGKKLIGTILSGLGWDTAIETINQFTGVSQNRQQLGLSNSSERALMNVAAAGAGGAVLRTAGIGISEGVKKLRAKYGNQPINKPASQLLDEFESSGSAADNAVEFALQREALDEPLTEGATPQTMAVHQRKINEVESAFAEGRPIDDDVFPEYSPDRVMDDLQQLSDGLDIDLATTQRRVANLKKQIDNVLAENQMAKTEVGYMDRVTIPARKYGIEVDNLDLEPGATVEDVISALDIIREGAGEVDRPLMKLAREMGGIADEAGELKNFGVTGQTYPGFLNNKSGTTFDMFREAAEERGLIGRGQTVADALDALEFEIKTPSQRIGDEDVSQADQFLDEIGFDANRALERYRAKEGPEIKALKKEREALKTRLQDEGILDAAGRQISSIEDQVRTLNKREDDLLEAYENTEIAYLERDLREIEAGAPENRSITLERADGQMENIKLTEMLDELKADRAVLDSMKVCGI